jgi:hypothetical protein
VLVLMVTQEVLVAQETEHMLVLIVVDKFDSSELLKHSYIGLLL